MVKEESLDTLGLNEEIKLYRKLYFGKILDIYEFIVKRISRFIKLESSDIRKKEEFNKIKRSIDIDLDYDEIYTAQIFFIVLFLIFGFIFLIFSDILKFLILVLFGIFISYIIGEYLFILYNSIKNKKKAQLISLILYLTLKLRENPNLEQALLFAIKYIQPPLRLDLLSLMRDIVNKRYLSAAEALDTYAKEWADEAPFFLSGMQLIITSSYEQNPIERERILDRAVEDTLDTFLIYLESNVRELKGPIDLISVFGITFPTLLLTIFPIAAVFLSTIFSPTFLFILVDIIIPILVFLILKGFLEGKVVNIFATGSVYYYLFIKEREKISLNIYALILSISLSILIMFLLFNFVFNFLQGFKLLNIILAAVFIFSIGIGISVYYYIYYMAFRDLDIDLSKIEEDISSFTFALGNVLLNNIPIEEAIIRIYPRFKNRPIGKFLEGLYKNLKLGVPFHVAVFDKKIGVLKKYPSAYLEATMELLSESSMVSPKNAGKVAISIAKYFRYLDKVRSRFLDLVAESISQVKVLSRFVGPAILSVVVSVSIVSLYILYGLGVLLQNIRTSVETPGEFTEYISYSFIDILSLFNPTEAFTPQKLYMIVGIFNILISYLGIMLILVIEVGDDKIKKSKRFAVYTLQSSVIFFIFSVISTIALWHLVSPLVTGFFF